MLAQSSPAAIANAVQDSTSPQQKVSSLITLVTQFLNSEGIAADAAGLAKRLQGVDVAKGDSQAIFATVSAHLLEDLKVERRKAEEVLQKGREMMSAVLPGLGVSVAATTLSTGTAATKKREAVKITDVRDFKAGLQVSKGPRAVRELSDFEDLESKL